MAMTTPVKMSRHTAILGVVSLLGLVMAGPQAGSDADNSPIVPAMAVVGGRANLPCSLTSGQPGDRPELVLWYRDTSGAPIYSVDARGVDLSEATHWQNDQLLVHRTAEFHTDTAPPVLALDNVREADAGVYRCRVDFQMTPTQYSRVNLTVIVPPDRPVIRLPTGRLVGETIGPLTEGNRLQLICETQGGNPRPRLTWWMGAKLVSKTHMVTSTGALRSVLTLPAISRRNVDQVLSCHAANNNISAPLSRSVVLQTYFRPLFVRLEGHNRAMSLGRVHHVTCRTAGSRPPPLITWWIDDLELQDFTVQTSLDRNETTSVLSINASQAYNGKHLICRVENPELPNSVMEDAWRITVKYPPEVRLELGRQFNPGALKEGDDIYFDCIVKANPWIYKLEWLHDGQQLHHSASDGVIVTNMSLALQHITRRNAGSYVCRVENSEGEDTSNPIQLSVQHAPVCVTNQRREYHVARYEQVTVPCMVEANPADLTFQWRLNNTNSTRSIPAERFHTSGTTSHLTLTPVDTSDYGTLFCTSANEVGEQRAPCLFELLPLAEPVGPPEVPTDCYIRNRTSASLHIRCTAGAAGGFPQLFYMEAYQAKTHQLVSNLTNRQRPDFVLDNLGPGEELVVHVYSVSERGKSGLVTLEADTLKVAELKTRQEEESDGLKFTPLIGILLGAIGALLLITIAVVVTLRRVRSRDPPPRYTQEPEESREKMLAKTPKEQEYLSDRSPDVVPCKMLDRRKDWPLQELKRLPPTPPLPPSVAHLSQTVKILPNSGLPRKHTNLDTSDPRMDRSVGLYTFPRSPSMDLPGSLLSERRGYTKGSPSPAPPSEPYSIFDSSEPSELASSIDYDKAWQESMV